MLKETKIFILFLLVFAVALFVYDISQSAEPNHRATVLVQLMSGEREMSHGSGTYISPTKILTAAHVIPETLSGSVIMVTDRDGDSREAKLLWANKEFDVAVIQTEERGDSFSDVTCSELPIGTKLKATGYPFDLGFVESPLSIIGDNRPITNPDGSPRWGDAVLVEGVVGAGMSGGAVWLDGKIAGIVVGMRWGQSMFGPVMGAPSGFALLTSGPALCNLLKGDV